MRLFSRLLVAGSLLLAASLGRAQSYEYAIAVPQCPGASYCGWYTDVTALANAYGATIGSTQTGGGHTCTFTYVYDSHSFAPGQYTGGLTLRGNGQRYNGTQCVSATDQTVVRTIMRRDFNGCAAGPAGTENFTTGWSRHSPDAYPEGSTTAETRSIATGASYVGTSACVDGCTVTIGAPNSVWHARTPNDQGLYRLSATYSVSRTGAACSGTDPRADPSTPSPPCPGYAGELNGRRVCVAPAGTSDPTTAHDGGLPARRGNPPAGGDGTGNLGSSGGGAGGSAGGPGRSGDGDIRGGTEVPGTEGGEGDTVEVEVNTCGRPGEPACKIDETGTPSEAQGRGIFGDANSSADAAGQAREDQITGLGGASSRTSLPWVPSVLQLPNNACQVFTTQVPPYGALTLDLCNSEAVALWRAALGWLLGMLTVLYAWRALVAAPSGGK